MILKHADQNVYDFRFIAVKVLYIINECMPYIRSKIFD